MDPEPNTQADGVHAGAPALAARTQAPRGVLIGAIIWAVLLTGIFASYLVSKSVRDWFPATIGAKIPVTVLFFGALGGFLLSLSGIVEHGETGWDGKYNIWHPVRPFLGAVMGSIGCVLLLVTTDVSTTGPVHTDVAFYDGVAFVLGYAEASFRNLIAKVTQVIVGPGTPPSKGP
jgi:hypothetical protein